MSNFLDSSKFIQQEEAHYGGNAQGKRYTKVFGMFFGIMFVCMGLPIIGTIMHNQASGDVQLPARAYILLLIPVAPVLLFMLVRWIKSASSNKKIKEQGLSQLRTLVSSLVGEDSARLAQFDAEMTAKPQCIEAFSNYGRMLFFTENYVCSVDDHNSGNEPVYKIIPKTEIASMDYSKDFRTAILTVTFYNVMGSPVLQVNLSTKKQLEHVMQAFEQYVVTYNALRAPQTMGNAQ